MLLATMLAAVTLATPRPLMRDFIGLNVHTVQFKPDLYRPVATKLRNYHGFTWDVGDDSAYRPKFPMARNGVSWQELYGGWKGKGFATSTSLMFEELPIDKWKDVAKDAEAYGYDFAKFFGPSGKGWVEALEIGNEPGKLDDATYRKLFQAAATGARRGDPKLKIATCAVAAKPSAEWHKSVETVKGLETLYDALNVHSYAMLKTWPTWERSYPEDPRLTWIKDIQDVIAWRDQHAKGKEIWLTEFGWDASTQKAKDEWVGVTDEQQAQYIVRSFLLFSAMDLDRAYLYWFNDEDKPSLHAASGITRNYKPKPSFHAMAHLQKALGNYRFERAVRNGPEVYVYEFRHEDDRQRVFAVWSAGGKQSFRLPARPPRVERMAMKEGTPEVVPLAGRDIELDGTPQFVFYP
jgi:serine/threonine-protein kinase ATR